MNRLATTCLLACTFAVYGCSGSHRPSGDGGPGSDGGRVSDGGAATDAGTCLIDCAPPGMGCHYEGSGSCDPPRCPTLVCEDAGICLPCVPPPVGCDYVDGCTCSGLMCDDVACGPSEPNRFPTFDRTCDTEADCYVAMHLTDCCGSVRAMGIAVSETPHFDAAEMQCDEMYPACGCASALVTADDDTTNMSGGELTLACAAGECTTTFSP